jgi:hypothetical protein
MACLDVQTSWHFRFHKPLLRRMRMAIGIRKPVSGSLCRLSVPLLLGPLFQRIDGPQTTGGTQSYALKQFLRSLFQIPTGDRDDADFTPKEDMPAQTRQPVQDAPRPKAAPLRQLPKPKPILTRLARLHRIKTGSSSAVSSPICAGPEPRMVVTKS